MSHPFSSQYGFDQIQSDPRFAECFVDGTFEALRLIGTSDELTGELHSWLEQNLTGYSRHVGLVPQILDPVLASNVVVACARLLAVAATLIGDDHCFEETSTMELFPELGTEGGLLQGTALPGDSLSSQADRREQD